MNNALTIFKTLQGKWKFNRTISGFGSVTGTANFQPIETEKEALFYKEEGVLIMDNGTEINIHREYVYRYKDDKITAYFFENEKTDRLFHTLSFENSENKAQLEASASHLCVNDTYKAKYNFFNEKQFKLTYNVKGPQKNYIAETYFDKENSDFQKLK